MLSGRGGDLPGVGLHGSVRELGSRRGDLPHREPYLRLSHAFARDLLRAHQELLRRVEEELGRGGG